jgi:hypothetical protein
MVRLAQLIQRPVRALVEPAVRAAFGGIKYDLGRYQS